LGDVRVIQKLPNGNFEVTPAFIYEFWKMKKELDKLKGD